MNKLLRKVVYKLRVKFLPTEHDKMVEKWFTDDGDSTLRLEYDLDKHSIVFDLGGYKGQWASDIYARYNCKVLIFEPIETFAKSIKARFINNPNIRVFPFALGSSKRSETISLCGDSSSIYRESPERQLIQVEDVADFFAVQEIYQCDLMKINIEGGEYELLPRLIETNIISKIRDIQIQFHNISSDSETKMRRICNDLSKTHSPTYQYKFVWENWSRNNEY